MLRSYIVYLLLLVVCCGLALAAQRWNRSHLLIWLVLALTLVAGLRGNTVGFDTQTYVTRFYQMMHGETAYGFETSFVWLCTAFLRVFPSPNCLLLMFALLTNGAIVLRLWDFRGYASFVWMTLCYYVSFYFFTFNIMRQMCAVAIVFYATRYVPRKQYFRFLIFVAAAALLHRSALIGLIFLTIECLQWQRLKIRQQVFFVAGLLMVPLAAAFLLPNIGFYLKYFTEIAPSIGLMLPVKIALLAVSAKGLLGTVIRENGLESTRRGELQFVRMSYFIGILLTLIGYFYAYMDRIGLVFYLFECVYYGMLVKTKKNGKLYGVIIALLLLYAFARELQGNGQGVLPYVFFWQSP